MLTIEKNTQVNFKTNSDLLEKAKEIFAVNDLDLTGVFNLFLQNVVIKNELPLLTEEELEREKLFLQLQEEVRKSIDDVEQGKGVTLTEARKRFGI